jgi:hypothetical protein
MSIFRAATISTTKNDANLIACMPERRRSATQLIAPTDPLHAETISRSYDIMSFESSAADTLLRREEFQRW